MLVWSSSPFISAGQGQLIFPELVTEAAPELAVSLWIVFDTTEVREVLGVQLHVLQKLLDCTEQSSHPHPAHRSSSSPGPCTTWTYPADPQPFSSEETQYNWSTSASYTVGSLVTSPLTTIILYMKPAAIWWHKIYCHDIATLTAQSRGIYEPLSVTWCEVKVKEGPRCTV